jgi:hypothetical protein
MKIFGYNVEECLTFFMLIVIGYFIAKMFSQKCNGFSVGAQIDCESITNPAKCHMHHRHGCEFKDGECGYKNPPPPPPRYKCDSINNLCKEDAAGPFLSKKLCNDSNCMAGARSDGEYDCRDGHCYRDPTHQGAYKDKTECETFCARKNPGEECSNRIGECKGDHQQESKLCVLDKNDGKDKCVECVSNIKDPNLFCMWNGKKNHTCVDNKCKLMNNGKGCNSNDDCDSKFCNKKVKLQNFEGQCELNTCKVDNLQPPDCDTCLNENLKFPHCDTCKISTLKPPHCNICKYGSRLEPPDCKECSINKLLKPTNCIKCINDLHKMPGCTECNESHKKYPKCTDYKDCNELNSVYCPLNPLCELDKNNQCQSR